MRDGSCSEFRSWLDRRAGFFTRPHPAARHGAPFGVCPTVNSPGKGRRLLHSSSRSKPTLKAIGSVFYAIEKARVRRSKNLRRTWSDRKLTKKDRAQIGGAFERDLAMRHALNFASAAQNLIRMVEFLRGYPPALTTIPSPILFASFRVSRTKDRA